ncbi:MAG: gluconate 2-dehydrogenase subunit 3 family protein [Gemmatimonadota bacterium]
MKVVAAAPVAGSALVWSEPEVMVAHARAREALAHGAYEPEFFTASEWQLVRVLADLIIPRDERSGSATDVGVPEFLDFMMIDQPRNQERMRKGLAWIDAESVKRFGRSFVECDFAQHAALLDDLAWPKMAPEALKEGAAYFVSFRNLTLTGFWTTQVGIDDLQYMGNTFVPQWNGCPPEALNKLGVSYHE